MSPTIDAKTWTAMQTRAARSGLILMRSEGAAVVVVVVDREGRPHRVHTIDQLEAVLLAEAVA